MKIQQILICQNLKCNCEFIPTHANNLKFCSKKCKEEHRSSIKVNCKNATCNNLVGAKTATKLTGYCYPCSIKNRVYTYQRSKRPNETEKVSYIRKCPNINNNPNCKIEIQYSNNYNFSKAEIKNTQCSKCAYKKWDVDVKQHACKKSVETRRKNNTLKHSVDTKIKISNTLKKIYETGEHLPWNVGLTATTDERVAKTGKSRPGKLNPMYGRSYRDIWENLYPPDEFKCKMDYNGYLKSMSLLTFEDWKVERDIIETEFKKYKKIVMQWTNKNDLKTLENYEKRGIVAENSESYHLDHIISIWYGFNNNIHPKLIGSMENLRFIPGTENLKKNKHIIGEVITDKLKHYIISLLKKWNKLSYD
jgi:hypothetical protein